MIITSTRTMRNNVFRMELSTEVDSLDAKFIEQFGEPQIDTLGTIPMGEGSFVLAGGPRFAYVRTGMPIYYEVNGNTDEEAMEKTDAWGAEMVDRITTAMTALKAQTLPPSPSVSIAQA